MADYIDTATAMRNGDSVSFETLGLYEKWYNGVGGDAPMGTILVDQVRRVVSCLWRTQKIIALPPDDKNRPEAFLNAGFDLLPIIDLLCAGKPLDAATGFASVDAVLAAWKDNFTPVNKIPPPTFWSPPAIVPDDWWAKGEHRFVAVLRDPGTGKVLYLDRGTLARDGDTVTAATFALLGADAQRPTKEFSIAFTGRMRQARYDCAAGTMTALAEADFNRAQHLALQSQTASAPRGPEAKTEIDAVCAAPAADETSFRSFQDVWAHEQKNWASAPSP